METSNHSLSFSVFQVLLSLAVAILPALSLASATVCTEDISATCLQCPLSTAHCCANPAAYAVCRLYEDTDALHGPSAKRSSFWYLHSVPPVRRAKYFLGKRTAPDEQYLDLEQAKRLRNNFLGKRAAEENFLDYGEKRARPFLGKRDGKTKLGYFLCFYVQL
jgi:hypothetical protein